MSVRASFHQERLWFIDKFETGTVYESKPIYHNVPLIIDLKGEINESLLEESIGYLIRRHAILRINVKIIDDQLYQCENDSIPPFSIQNLQKNFCKDLNELIPLIIEENNKPFLLENDLMIRGALFSLNTRHKILLITFHHIIIDKLSLKIFMQELFATYRAKLHEENINLPELRINYLDYSNWQREMPSKLLRDLEVYWRRQLNGNIQPLQFYSDHKRANVHIYEPDSFNFTLPSQLSERIIHYCNSRNIKYNEIFLTVFIVLLNKYSGQEEIMVGINSGNRTQKGTENIVGPISNLLAIRNWINEEATFDDVLKSTTHTLEDAYKHQMMPFDLLVTKLSPNVDMSRTALFDVLFDYDEKTEHPLKIENLEIELIDINYGWGKYDLNFLVKEDSSGFSGIIVFNKKYYAKSTIQKLSQHYLTLLNNVVIISNEKIKDVSYITEEDKQQILYEYNKVDINYPKDKTIHKLFEEQVERTPNAIAIIKDDKQISYAEFNLRSNRLAHLLRSKGIQNDVVVGILADRSIDMVIAILAILKSGGAYLPIDTEYPEARKLYMIEDSKMAVALTNKVAGVEGANLDFIQINSFVDEYPASNLNLLQQSCTLAYIIYTSGTTGLPKGSMIEHHNVVSLLFNKNSHFDFSEIDIWTMFHSYCFDFSVWEMYGALLFGGKLVVIPKTKAKDPVWYLKLLRKFNVTILNQTPSYFYGLCECEMIQLDRGLKLRYIIFGGEALNPGKLSSWNERYPHTKLINMYGITETTVHVTFKEIKNEEIKEARSNIGKPLPTLGIYILNKSKQIVPVGVAGEIYVWGEGVCRGYLYREELTEERFIRNPFRFNTKMYRTGDMGRWLPDGSIEYLGRIDEQVKIRGYRIELGEIESRIREYEGVKETVVVTHEKEGNGKQIVAYYVSEDDLDLSGLKFHLVNNLPDYMIPTFFLRIQKIPLTVNGKINKKELPEPLPPNEIEHISPSNDLENAMVEIWSSVLGIDKNTISLNSNFFELGGNSLSLVKLNNKLKSSLQLDLSIAVLFQYFTISSFIAYLKTDKKNEPIPDESREEVEEKGRERMSELRRKLKA